MNKIRVIDLLNKIANGEELPKKIKYNNKIWRLASDGTYFIGSDYGYDFWLEHGDDKFEDEPITLNDEVEIIEEEKRCTVETCCMGIEGLSKSLLKIKDDMKSIYENIDKVETLEEEKKIPEKLNISNFPKHNNSLKKTAIKVNEIIDFLKSKGDE